MTCRPVTLGAAFVALPMTVRYCEIALPVPLRSAFTYAIPAALNGESLVGRRVLAPFRNRPMVGVCLAESDSVPESILAKSRSKQPAIKEIAGLIDPVAALPPKLLDLGHWISRYYLAPIGETFRAMLPPEVELRHGREFRLSDAGRVYLQESWKSNRRSLAPKALSVNYCAALLRKTSPFRKLPSVVSPEARTLPRSSCTVDISPCARWCARERRARRKYSRGMRRTHLPPEEPRKKEPANRYRPPEDRCRFRC